MPCSKVGKKRASVNVLQLTSAAKLCLTGEVSIREAAQRYNVSKTTLIRHVNSFKKKVERTNFRIMLEIIPNKYSQPRRKMH